MADFALLGDSFQFCLGVQTPFHDEMGVGTIVWEKRGPVIRQAISCDICGRDKQQTNHWFVVYEHGSELRISGWSSQARTSTRAKHLCGQTCLHKLVDEFIARTIAARCAALQDGPEGNDVVSSRCGATATDTSLTSSSAHPGARRSPTTARVPNRNEIGGSERVIPVTENEGALETLTSLNPPAYNTRTWRAEAWRREQERARHGVTGPPAPRRRSIA